MPRPSSIAGTRIALLNLMPDKIATETQFARLLAGSGLDIELILVCPDNYIPRTSDPAHIAKFYKPISQMMQMPLDGLIVTGAPVECRPYKDVTYWPQFIRTLEWAERNIQGTLFICWAAQGALYHRYGVPKYRLPQKLFGLYDQHLTRTDALAVQGITPHFTCPVSRHTEIRATDIPDGSSLQTLASSTESGLCLLEDPRTRSLYMFNHLEYDVDTLGKEYGRDRAIDTLSPPPASYFPNGDTTLMPENTWHSSGQHLIRNWLHHYCIPARRLVA